MDVVVRAAMTNNSYGIIDNWIRHIKDVYRFHSDELDDIKDENDRFEKFVELNVVEQVYDLAKTSIVQNAWKSGDKLSIHGWVFSLSSGLINDLNITFDNDSQLSETYKLNL